MVVAAACWKQLERAGDAPRLARELAELLPPSPPAFVVLRDRSNRALFRRARRLAGARVA
jgi:hypothetical protein